MESHDGSTAESGRGPELAAQAECARCHPRADGSSHGAESKRLRPCGRQMTGATSSRDSRLSRTDMAGILARADFIQARAFFVDSVVDLNVPTATVEVADLQGAVRRSRH